MDQNIAIDLIKLNECPADENGMTYLRTTIRERLDDDLFEFHSMEELVFEILKMIDQTASLVTSPEMVNQGMEVILKYFKKEEPDTDLIKPFASGKIRSMLLDKYFNFYFYIVGLRDVPYNELIEIKPIVEKDLSSLNKLIQTYEESPEIKDFKRLNHVIKKSELKKVHFYWRCIDERQKILDYYFKGMYEWAIRLSSHFMDRSSAIYMITMMTYKPYDFNHNPSGPNYDSENIDRALHRLHAFESLLHYEKIKYVKLYESDKKEFYKEIFKLRPKTEILANIKSMSEPLLHDDRKFIFDEMLNYFDKKEWLAFYAIALPQIEGLFHVMIESESLNNSMSLSTKARAMRTSSYIDNRALDYFEYELPSQRNNFAHGGLLDKEPIEILAYDLLTDLECLVYMFSELQNSYVRATRMVGKDAAEKLDNLDSLVVFTTTILSLTPIQEKPLLKKIQKVNKDILLEKEGHFKWLFREYGVKYDFGKAELNEKLEIMGLNKIEIMDAKDLKKDAMIEIRNEFLGFLLQTVSTWELLEAIRKYGKKYFEGKFFEEELIEYGKNEKKAMNNIRTLYNYEPK